MAGECSNRSIGQNRDSKTLWQDRKNNYPPKGKNNIPRLDIEGNDIHLHVGNDNRKYFYDDVIDSFVDKDNIEISKLLKKKIKKDSEFQKALNDALKKGK